MNVSPALESLHRLIFSLLCGAFSLSCLSPTPLEAQVSTGLGGDLTGAPSNARVVRVDGVPVDLSGAAAGDVLKIVDGSIVPAEDETGGGGGGSVSGLHLIWSLPVTATYSLSTVNTTVATIVLDSSKAVTNTQVWACLVGTITCTSTAGQSWRPALYANGHQVVPPQIQNLTSSATRWFSLRFNYGLISLPGFDNCFEINNLPTNDGAAGLVTSGAAAAGLTFPFPFGLASTQVRAGQTITLELTTRSTAATYLPSVSTYFGWAHCAPGSP